MPTLLLLMVLAGLNAGAARSLAAAPAAYRVYFIVTLGPLVVRFLTLEDGPRWALALATATYILFLFSTAKQQYDDLTRRWRLTFEHELLAKSLQEAKEQAEGASPTSFCFRLLPRG